MSDSDERGITIEHDSFAGRMMGLNAADGPTWGEEFQAEIESGRRCAVCEELCEEPGGPHPECLLKAAERVERARQALRRLSRAERESLTDEVAAQLEPFDEWCHARSPEQGRRDDILAGHWITLGRRVEAGLQSLNDDGLRAEAARRSASESSSEFDAFVAKTCDFMLAMRSQIKRAEEVGGDCYCPAHDCRCEACPAGAHD